MTALIHTFFLADHQRLETEMSQLITLALTDHPMASPV